MKWTVDFTCKSQLSRAFDRIRMSDQRGRESSYNHFRTNQDEFLSESVINVVRSSKIGMGRGTSIVWATLPTKLDCLTYLVDNWNTLVFQFSDVNDNNLEGTIGVLNRFNYVTILNRSDRNREKSRRRGGPWVPERHRSPKGSVKEWGHERRRFLNFTLRGTWDPKGWGSFESKRCGVEDEIYHYYSVSDPLNDFRSNNVFTYLLTFLFPEGRRRGSLRNRSHPTHGKSSREPLSHKTECSHRDVLIVKSGVSSGLLLPKPPSTFSNPHLLRMGTRGRYGR